jgi:uncharacterized DUF497 family protein
VHTLGESDGFEWDPVKAQANIRKHGIDFAEVTTVFDDERALTMPDILTAVDEQRLLTLGRDALSRIVVVAYTWRGQRIRIFSARRALPRERSLYRERGR